jgi:hypothetical protein
VSNNPGSVNVAMFGLLTCFSLLLLLAVGTIRRPAVGFAAILCLFGLKQWGQNTSSLLAYDRTIVNFAVALIVVVGAIGNWGKFIRRDQGQSTVWLLVLILYLYALVTVAWAPEIQTSLEQWSAALPYLLLIVVLAPLLIDDFNDVKTIANWTVAVGGGVCALALLFGTWGTRGLLVRGDFIGTVQTNPLAIANLGGTVVVLALVTAARPGRWYVRTFFLAMMPIGTAVILRSDSRGQLVAAAVAALFGMMLVSRRRNFQGMIALGVGALVMTGIGFWIWEQQGIHSSRWTDSQSAEDIGGRIAMATSLLSIATSSFPTAMFGAGNSSSFHYIGIYPHIAPLEILAEEGLVGFALYAAACVLAARTILKLWRSSRLRQQDDLQYGVSILAALFLFEWILTWKQASLLSSTYAFAYAIVLDRLRFQLQPVEAAQGVLAGSGNAQTLFGNLMK